MDGMDMCSPQERNQLDRSTIWKRARMRLLLVLAVALSVVAILLIWGPNGATYEEYLRLHEGMARQDVETIIGQGDYWFHYEGDRQVTNWVNEDGTYIRAVFDPDNRLVEVSWESGWNPEWETEQ